ncbi:uncharacterized protein HaLaN_31214, partial [Haematococcus lacustris]
MPYNHPSAQDVKVASQYGINCQGTCQSPQLSKETKLRRCDLDRELALADGWESFFAFNRGPTGYTLRSQALQQPLWQGQSVAELMALDQEGRVVITDHGQFVLLNWYGVAITSDHNADERIALKLR